MYAVVAVGEGHKKQYVMTQGETVLMDRRKAEPGEQILFNEVLLVRADDEIKVGTPLVEGASVQCRVLGHEKGKKIRVERFKRRKGYRRVTGHRQSYTRVLVEEVKA